MVTGNMKTMLVSDIFPPTHGGSGRWFWEVYSHLPTNEYVLAVGEHPNQVEFDRQHALTIERVPLKSPSWGFKSMTGLRFYWRTYRALRKLVKKHSVTFVHCGRCLPEGVMAFLLKITCGTPYLCYIHGEDIETAGLSRELSILVKLALKNANTLICNSNNTANLLRSKWDIPDSKIAVIHPGVDTARFIPAPYNIEIRNTLGWGNRPVILTVGRLQERKGQDMLIRALPIIRRSIPDVLYAIVGNGEMRPTLEALSQELEVSAHVMLMDEISDSAMIQCYQQCTLFVLPNRQVGNDIEGFGMVLVEAQACGKYVLAGLSGGTAETLIAGKTGDVIDCTDPTNLANAIIQILQDEAQLTEATTTTRQHASLTFDWKNIRKQSETLFKAQQR